MDNLLCSMWLNASRTIFYNTGCSLRVGSKANGNTGHFHSSVIRALVTNKSVPDKSIHFDPRWRDRYVISKCWKPFTEWRGFISPKNGNPKCNATKISALARQKFSFMTTRFFRGAKWMHSELFLWNIHRYSYNLQIIVFTVLLRKIFGKLVS